MAATTHHKAAGTGSGQRQLNGVQTSGRVYRERGEPNFGIAARTARSWRTPRSRPRPRWCRSLAYPRQVQDLGAPLEVERLIVDRRTNAQIADELFLSPKTVETHVRHLFEKLSVSSRVDVARVVERAERSR